MQSSGFAAVRQWPTLSFTHWTCKFDLISEFIRLEMVMPPPCPPPPRHADRLFSLRNSTTTMAE